MKEFEPLDREIKRLAKEIVDAAFKVQLINFNVPLIKNGIQRLILQSHLLLQSICLSVFVVKSLAAAHRRY